MVPARGRGLPVQPHGQTLSQYQHVAACLGVGKVERKGKSPRVLSKPQRAGTGAAQHIARRMVEKGQNITAKSRPEGTGRNALPEASQVSLSVERGGIALDLAPRRAEFDSEGTPFKGCRPGHAFATSVFRLGWWHT